ncbi:hypothetical protein [Neotabrizicola sp. sgz301269]|uniref:hypothetical protein n=1 Tax=Neotabrizicola sp. sgz301269 TaxID=3276282 RepID=UPI0037701275
MRRPRFSPPSSVVETLCIETGSITIDARGSYAVPSGKLLSVEIDGKWLEPKDVQTGLSFMGNADYTRWSDDLDEDDLAALVGEAMADKEADWADAARDFAAE